METYEELLNEATDGFVNNVMPYIKSDNKPENIEIVIRREVGKILQEIFVQGQLNVLNKEGK